MILAAGFGTRLGPLTEQRPKPMLPICGAPLVTWAVRWLVHHGVHDIVVNLHHLGEQIEAELGDGSRHGARVQYSHEEGMILGTGGGLRQARPLFDDGTDRPLVVVNGKILVDFDLATLLRQHEARHAEATMVLRPDHRAAQWGSLRLAPDGRIVELLTRRRAGEEDAAAGPPLMFTGIHVMQPRFLDRIPPEGEQCIIRTAYRQAFDEGAALYGVSTDRYWWEHSTPARYLEGVANVLEGRVDLAYSPGPIVGVDPRAEVSADATIVPPVWIGPRAQVLAGATVGPRVQLGADTRVAAGVTVRDAIVWDGAEVTTDVEASVVTPLGTVQ
jgi:NDP-sugar pyrophosphorylase family protein